MSITKRGNSHFQNRKENVLKWLNSSIFTWYCYTSTSQFRITYCEKSQKVSLFINYFQLSSPRVFEIREPDFPLQFLSTCHTDLALPSFVIGITSDAIKISCFFAGTGLKVDIPVTPLVMERNTKGIASNQREDKKYLHLFTLKYNYLQFIYKDHNTNFHRPNK